MYHAIPPSVKSIWVKVRVKFRVTVKAGVRVRVRFRVRLYRECKIEHEWAIV